MDTKKLELLKILNNNIQSEAKHGTSRNSYFLVVTSILILALSQFDDIEFQKIVAFIGSILCITWILMHWRSSNYINHWKKESRKVDPSEENSKIYPKKLGGFEIRTLGFILPLAFLCLWLTFLWFLSNQ